MTYLSVSAMHSPLATSLTHSLPLPLSLLVPRTTTPCTCTCSHHRRYLDHRTMHQLAREGSAVHLPQPRPLSQMLPEVGELQMLPLASCGSHGCHSAGWCGVWIGRWGRTRKRCHCLEHWLADSRDLREAALKPSAYKWRGPTRVRGESPGGGGARGPGSRGESTDGRAVCAPQPITWVDGANPAPCTLHPAPCTHTLYPHPAADHVGRRSQRRPHPHPVPFTLTLYPHPVPSPSPTPSPSPCTLALAHTLTLTLAHTLALTLALTLYPSPRWADGMQRARYFRSNEQMDAYDHAYDRLGPDRWRTAQPTIPRAKACPNQCNGRGTCAYGFCHCRRGFWGLDCSLSAERVSALAKARASPRVYIYEVPASLRRGCGNCHAAPPPLYTLYPVPSTPAPPAHINLGPNSSSPVHMQRRGRSPRIVMIACNLTDSRMPTPYLQPD